MIERLYSAVKRRRRGRAITSESGTAGRGPGAGAPAALAASPLRSEAANAAEEVLVLLVLIKGLLYLLRFSNSVMNKALKAPMPVSHVFHCFKSVRLYMDVPHVRHFRF
jgi:hypothetical protein